MAATRLIAMHQNKGRSLAQCLKDRTDYAKNGEKTENGELISSYACDKETVDQEFLLSKQEYLRITGRRPKDVKEALEPRNGTDYEAQHHTMEKPNGSYEAVTVKPDDNMIGVNLNASALYKEYENGTPYETIVKGSTDIADKALKDGPDFNVDNFKDYDKMKGTLAMEVVSKERNAGLLENIPHKDL